jgi:hypothetical protein
MHRPDFAQEEGGVGPFRGALLASGGFVTCGVLPSLPWLLSFTSNVPSTATMLGLSAALGVVGLFGLGVMRSKATRRPDGNGYR